MNVQSELKSDKDSIDDNIDSLNENLSIDGRSPLAIGYAWATRISGIGFEMALPAFLGLWLDRKLGTVALFLILGTFIGMGIGFLQLLRIAKEGNG